VGRAQKTGLGSDVLWLRRANHWLKERAEIIEDAGSTVIIRKNQEELGRIVDGELQPTKFISGGSRIDDAGSGYDFYKSIEGGVGFKARFVVEYDYGEVVVRLENGIEVGQGGISFGGFFEAQIQTIFNGRRLEKGENVFNLIYDRASLDGEILGIRALLNEALPDNLKTFNALSSMKLI
jgi:hypothetical protein